MSEPNEQVVTSTAPLSEPSVSEAPNVPAVAAAAAALIVPGLGHFVLGRRGRAAIFFALVTIAGVTGVLLQGRLDWPVAGKPLSLLSTIASMGMGTLYWLLRIVGYTGELTGPGFEYGTAFIRCAGVMNLLLVLDSWDIASGRKV